jgi:hypothetical protein
MSIHILDFSENLALKNKTRRLKLPDRIVEIDRPHCFRLAQFVNGYYGYGSNACISCRCEVLEVPKNLPYAYHVFTFVKLHILASSVLCCA